MGERTERSSTGKGKVGGSGKRREYYTRRPQEDPGGKATVGAKKRKSVGWKTRRITRTLTRNVKEGVTLDKRQVIRLPREI